MRSAKIRVALVALAALGMAGFAAADEEKIAVKQLPKAVRKAAKAKFPKAKIVSAAKEEADGETIYEVSLTIKGRTVDVAMDEDGEIREIEKEIETDELPKKVAAAVKAKYPKATIAKVESVTKGEDGPVTYEVSVTTEIVLSAKGKFIEADEEDEEDEKPAAKGKKSGKEEDEDDDEMSVKKKKGEKEDEDEDDDEKSMKKKGEKEGEDGEEKSIKKKGEKEDEDEDDDKKTVKKKGEKEDEDEDGEDGDDGKKSVKKKKAEKDDEKSVKEKKKGEKDDEDDDEDEDDDDKPVKKEKGEKPEDD